MSLDSNINFKNYSFADLSDQLSSGSKYDYWNNLFNNYLNNSYNFLSLLDIPNLDSWPIQLLFNYDNVAQQFGNSILSDLSDMHFKTGMALLNSNDIRAQYLGLNMMNDSMPSTSFLTPYQTKTEDDIDISSLTGENIDYQKQILDSATKIGNQLTSLLGGKAALTVSSVSENTGRIANSVKSLKAIDAAKKKITDPDKLKSLGRAKTGNAFAIAGSVADIAGNFLPEKTEYEGLYGDTTKTMDAGYDAIKSAAYAFGPVGMVVGGSMQLAEFLGKGLNALGGGTDGVTATDAVLGSNFFNWNIGAINGFGGTKLNTITKDEDVFTNIGASYTASNKTIDDAVKYSGKKVGLIGRLTGQTDDLLDKISDASNLMYTLGQINNLATTQNALRNSMSYINGTRRSLKLSGGLNPYLSRGKHGMVLQAKKIANQYNISKRKEKYQKGGTIEDFQFTSYLNSLPDYLKSDKDFRVRDYWEFNGRPKNFAEAIVKGMFTFNLDDNRWHANSVAQNPNTDEIEYMKSSNHPNHQMEVNWYYSDNAKEFRKEWDLIKSDPYWKYVRKNKLDEAKKFKDGGSLNINNSILIAEEPEDATEGFKKGGTLNINSIIMAMEPEDEIPEFKEGGSFNVIPEGALHARLHHMENADNLTKKGIPVVAEKEGGELEQQAEIEREEIIFRLEVTKKLEELAKDGSDKAAIEAGKLLVEEILNNTIDNTNKLL